MRGRAYSEDKIRRIIHLLRNTDMDISAIAERMRCSRSLVVAINRRYSVRSYEGRRGQWHVDQKVS